MGEGLPIPWRKGNDFLMRCGEVHEPYRFCVTVLEGMRGIVPFDQGLFLMLDANRKITRKYFLDFPKYWKSIYLEYYARSEHAFGLDEELSESMGRPYAEVISWDDYDWIHDDFMEHYIRARGLRHSLTFVLFDLYGAPATAFSLDRMRDEPFSSREVQAVTLAVGHLNNLYKNLFVRPVGQVRMWDGATGADELTPREREVVDLICQGISPANISRELHISIGTTNKHIAHIYRKLDVGNRQELLVRLLGK